MSYLVGNPEDRFSRDEAQIILKGHKAQQQFSMLLFRLRPRSCRHGCRQDRGSGAGYIWKYRGHEEETAMSCEVLY